MCPSGNYGFFGSVCDDLLHGFTKHDFKKPVRCGLLIAPLVFPAASHRDAFPKPSIPKGFER
jgi:hypothetical protein